MAEVQEANEAKARLEAYVSRLSVICNVFVDKGNVTKEAIDEALSLTADLQIGQITLERIDEARKPKKEEDAKMAIKDTYYLRHSSSGYDTQPDDWKGRAAPAQQNSLIAHGTQNVHWQPLQESARPQFNRRYEWSR
jgi:hypothetical protein